MVVLSAFISGDPLRYVGDVMGLLMTHDFMAALSDTPFTQQDTSRG